MKLLYKLRNRFIKGLLIILPIGITIWIILKILDFLDLLSGKYLASWIGFRIPGLGLLVTVTLIVAVGSFGSHYVGKSLTKWVQSQFEKLPVIKAIYTPLKDITNNFSNKNSNNFKQVVLMTYPVEGNYSIGFVTKENVEMAGELMTGVFIPTTPNPTNGFLVFVKKGAYRVLDIPVEDALKTVVSLGSITPDQVKEMR